jgi:hypothetical protein
VQAAGTIFSRHKATRFGAKDTIITTIQIRVTKSRLAPFKIIVFKMKVGTNNAVAAPRYQTVVGAGVGVVIVAIIAFFTRFL